MPHVAAVESDYTGPRLDDDITAEFMTELVTHLRDQKKLHKKYAYKVSIGRREGGRESGWNVGQGLGCTLHTHCVYVRTQFVHDPSLFSSDYFGGEVTALKPSFFD